jgi:endonuclease/exonuclease/phosphatase family metal-dependent hydrolase
VRRRERAVQAIRLAAHLEDNARTADIVVLAGDLNSWWPRAREVRILERAVGPSLKPRTFPSTRPVFRLDRVFVHPKGRVADWGVATDPFVRIASDHLPVWVDLGSS